MVLGLVGEDHGVHPGGIGGSEDPTEVPRLFDAVQHEDHGAAMDREVVDRACGVAGNTEQAIWMTTHRELLEHRAADFEHDGCPRGELRSESQLGRQHALVARHGGSRGAFELAMPFDQESARFCAALAFLETRQCLDARVGGARDRVGRAHQLLPPPPPKPPPPLKPPKPPPPKPPPHDDPPPPPPKPPPPPQPLKPPVPDHHDPRSPPHDASL